MVKWLKKISMFMLIALCSGLMLVGCGDKYSRLSLSLSHAGGTNVIELVLVDNSAVTYDVMAIVDGAKRNVSEEVIYTVENGDNISVSSHYEGKGKTKLTILATSHGTCTLTVRTKEGNKSKSLTIIVYKKLESINFTTDKLAIRKNSSLDLNNFIDYLPHGTNQTGAKYELVRVLDEEGNTFAYSENYAFITDTGILTVDPEATLPIDAETNLPYVSVKATSIFDESITTEVLNIPVIDMVEEGAVSVFSNSNSGQVQLVKNKDGVYHVVLASNIGFTDVEGANDVLFKRRLTFIIGDNVEDEQKYNVLVDKKYFESYQTSPNRTEAEKAEFAEFPVLLKELNRIDGHATFDVNQKRVNEITIPFRIKYQEFDGLPEIVVNIKFEVLAFPTEISAKNNNQEVTELNPLKVMNEYTGNLSGAPLTISTNNDSVSNRLYFTYKIEKGTALTAKVKVATSNSKIEYEPETNILSGTTLYLFHDYSDTDVESITDSYIVITYTYDLNPASIGGEGEDASTGSFAYSIEKQIPLTFRMGIDEVPFVSDIVANNYELKLDASKPSVTKIIDTSESGGVYADEFTYTANTNLFTLDVQKTEVYLCPNTEGISGEYTLVVRDSMRNLYKACKIIIYVPFASGVPNSMVVEIDSENNYKEQILSREYEDKEVILTTSSEVGLTKTYQTLTKLVLKTGSSIPLNAFNFILDPAKDSSVVKAEDDLLLASEKYIKKVNVNHYLEGVDMLSRYGEYKNGYLTIGQNTYTNTEAPLNVVFSFKGFDSTGASITVSHTIQLLIYSLINELNVSVSNPNIYEYNSVGALNANKASSTITITNTLNNAAEIAFEIDDVIVKTFYINDGTQAVDFRVSDLITINYTEGSNFIVITAKASGSASEVGSGVYKLNLLLRDYGSIENILSEIYATNFRVNILITLTQFGRAVHSSATLGTIYAVKSERIILNNINSNGLYFDIRNLSAGDKKDISFAIEPSNAFNKNINLIYDENNVFNCEMLSNNVVRIYPFSAGVATLRMAFEDSYEEVTGDGGVTTLVATRYIDIRIKVADGSVLYPFEINNISDLEGMVRDINNGANTYNYVFANNINFANYNYVAPTAEFNGSLDGLFQYELDGTRYSIQSNLINFGINITDSTKANVGLFEVLGESGIVRNLNFIDTNVNVALPDESTVDTLNVGVIAGINNGVIQNSRVFGEINVDTYLANQINVGAFAGYNSGLITGLPSVNSGLGDSNINSNVKINVARVYSITEETVEVAVATGKVNIGSIVGYSLGRYRDTLAKDVADIKELNVITPQITFTEHQIVDGVEHSNLVLADTMAIGGVAGYGKDSKISNITVRVVNAQAERNIGGILGIADNVYVYTDVVQFVNGGLTGLQASGIIGQTNLGALIGQSIGSTVVEYSYARSFYNKSATEIDNIAYYGNIVSIANGNSTDYSDANTINVGGLVGFANDANASQYLTVKHSYANVDINTSANPSNNGAGDISQEKYLVGGLVGSATTNTKIETSYVLNNIIMPSAIKQTKLVTVTIEKTAEEDEGVSGDGSGGEVPDDTETEEEKEIEVPSFGYFVGNEKVTGFSPVVLSVVETSYSVVNLNKVTGEGFIEYVDDTNVITNTEKVLTETLDDGEGGTYNFKYIMSKSDMVGFLTEEECFKITNDHEYNADPANTEKMDWYLNSQINEGLPVLFDGNDKILYTMLPSSITTVVSEESVEFSNNSHIKLGDNKVVLFYNRLTNGVEYLTNNTYKVVLEGHEVETGVDYNNVITVKLGIDAGLQGILEVEGAITIESSNINVITVENGNTIKTVGEGYAELLVYSTLDTTISTKVEILVVNGLSNFYLYKNGIGDSNIVSTEQELIIDKVNKYNVNIINKANTNGVNGVYSKNQNVGYIITASDQNTATLGLNTEESGKLNAGESYLFQSLGNMNLIGFTSGKATLTFTPIIFTANTDFGETIYVDGNRVLTDVEVQDAIVAGTITNYTSFVAIKVNALEKDFTFNVIEKAESLTFANGNTSKTILPTGMAEVEIVVVTSAFTKVSATEYIINEKLNVLIYKNGEEIGLLNISGNESSVEFESGKFKNRYNNSLIEFELSGDPIYTVIAGKNQLRLVYTIYLTFNKDKYLDNADSYSMNDLNYELKFYPATNIDLKELESSKYAFTIKPQEIGEINTAFYPSSQTTLTNEFNPLENATDYVAPGRYGLLAINVYPMFNEADYYEVTVPYEHRQNITLSQMYAIYDNSGTSSLFSGYQNAVPAASQLSDYMGIKLYNVSNTLKEFDGRLYVRVLVTSSIPQGTVLNFTVNAYKNGVATPIAEPAICTLSVSELPGITAMVDGQTSNIIVAKTFSKVGTIKAIEFSGNIEYEIVSRKGNSSQYQLELTETGFTFTALNTAFGGDDVTVTFSVYQIINGIREESSCTVHFKVVEYELLGVSVKDTALNDRGENQLDILNGVTKLLEVNITANIDPTNNSMASSKTNLEKHFAGQGTVSTSVKSPNNWYRRNSYNSDPYSDVSLTVESGQSLVFNQFEFVSKNEAYYIKGVRISDVNIFALKVAYYYDGNGIPRVFYTGLSTAYTIYELDFVFRLNIKDNSTYDHPNPVYTYEDIANMQTGSHYILMNNLTFENFVPFKVSDFASFDGNGYVITIENFDLSSYKTSGTGTSANIGLFETIASGTIVKNLVLDVSELLVSNYEMTTYLNSTNPEEIAKYTKINASDITSVNFGLIAATNSGTITNVKIINTSNTANNYLFVYTTQSKIGTSIPTARIGGFVATNNGVISNSFIGVNASTISGSKVYTGVVNGNYNTVYSYPFTLNGSNNISGIAYSNGGKIISTYANAIGITNTCFLGDDTVTAGFVGINQADALISNSFVQGSNITKFRASADYKVESKGNMGGLVCTNEGEIRDAYSNIAIATNSGRSGGFVFENTASGTITNAYSTAKNSVGSRAHGAFIGTNEIGEVNNGAKESALTSIYYLVVGDEYVNENEVATPINSTGEVEGGVVGASQSDPFLYAGSFNGFSFSLGSAMNSIWTYTDTNLGPQLISCVANDTYSNRTISDATEEVGADGQVSYTFNYDYVTNVGDQHTGYGEKNNPLIVRDGKEFASFIINNSNAQNVFGGENTTVSYVRLIDDISFTSSEPEKNINLNEYKVDGKKLSEVIFNGTLDGNNLTVSGIRLLDNSENNSKDTYGLFKQVGHDSNSDTYNAVIKNVTFDVEQLVATNVKMVGTVAGKSVNATYINTHITGDTVIQGNNIVGGLTGILAGNSSLIDITSEVSVSAVYRSTATITDVLPYFDYAFNMYSGNYEATLSYNNTDCNYSYAGGIAGILDANNTQILDSSNPDYASRNYREVVFNVDATEGGKYSRTTTKFRTDEPTAPIIKNLTVSGELTITGEHAGGLFGYIGKNTHVYNSLFELSNDSNQEINGLHLSGGIVGENHGILEKVRVEHEEDIQAEMDIKISTEGTVVGSKTLFKENSPIVIGGIVGLNDNAIIIDSYSKANVYNANAYVAGGIIGKNKGYALLQHVYTTGLVYAKHVMGGAIGYVNASKYAYYNGEAVYADPQYDAERNVVGYDNPKDNLGDPITLDKHEKVIMDYVVALNTWNSETDAVITDNFKTTYSYSENAETKYYSYTNVMPEVGNQFVEKMYKVHTKTEIVGGEPVTSFVNDFESSVGKEFATGSDVPYSYAYTRNIGAVIGRLSSYGNSVKNENLAYEIGGKSNGFALGILDAIETSANTARDNHDDTIKVVKDNHTGTVKELDQKDVTVYSLTYGTNKISNANITWSGDYNQEYHCYTYFNYLGWQRSRELVLGYDIEVEEGVTANLMQNNVFMAWINVSLGGGEKVFKIDEASGIPEFIVGIYSNMITISDRDEWVENIGVDKTTKNKYFAITKNFTVEYGSSHFGKFEGTMIGVGATKPIITFYASGDLVPVFNTINSANISNVDFVVVYTSGIAAGVTSGYTEYGVENCGLFANTAINSVFTNCSISVDYSAVERTIITQDTTNMGAVFGKISNTTLRFGENDEIKISNIGSSRINVQQSKDFSYGIFAGYVQKCDISVLPINIPNSTAARIGLGNLNVKTISVGGLVGTSVGTNYQQIAFKNPTANVDVYLYTMYNNSSLENGYVGGLFGKLESGSVGKVAHVGSVYVGPSAVILNSKEYVSVNDSGLTARPRITNIYAGGVVGYMVQSSSLSNVSNAVRFDLENVVSKISQYNLNAIFVNGYSQSSNGTKVIAVGGLVGRMNNGQINGVLNAENKAESANNAKIEINSDCTTASNYVGGVVGQIEGVQNKSTVSKVYNSGELIVSPADSSNNYVGGIVGSADMADVLQCQNFGEITQNASKHLTGGIIGAMGKPNTTPGEICNITECISYGDITVLQAINSNAMIGGIVGAGRFSEVSKVNVSKCISMSRPIGTNDNTNNIQGIASNVEQSQAVSNYYIAEFATGATIGTAIPYGKFETSIESIISGTNPVFEMVEDTIAPALIELYNIKELSGGALPTGEKFTPITVKTDADITSNQNYYYVVDVSVSELNITKTIYDDASGFEGLFASTDITVITYSLGEPLIKYNKGILSGIKLKVSGTTGITSYLVNTNYTSGVIYNCGILGLVNNTSLIAPIALSNQGRIIQTGVAMVNTATTTASKTSGFVDENTGVIYQCYSTLQMPNVSTGDFYGLIVTSSSATSSVKDSYFAGFYNGNYITPVVTGGGIKYESHILGTGSTSSADFFGGTDADTGKSVIGSIWTSQGANNTTNYSSINFGYPVLDSTQFPNALTLTTSYTYDGTTYSYSQSGGYLLVTHNGMFANLSTSGTYSANYSYKYLIVSDMTISSTYQNTETSNAFYGDIIGVGTRKLTISVPLFEKYNGGNITNLTLTTSTRVDSVIAKTSIENTNISYITFDTCEVTNSLITATYLLNIDASKSISRIVLKGTIKVTASSGNVGSIINTVTSTDKTKLTISYINYSNTIAIENLSITGTVGGLFGTVTGATLSYCYNKADITGTNKVGGVVGSLTDSIIKNSKNEGSINGTQYIGGIVGYASGTVEIKDCENGSYSTTKTITGTNDVGGILGYGATIIVDALTNNMSVTGQTELGGVVGSAYTTITFKNSIKNNGKITSTKQEPSNIGGIVGKATAYTNTDGTLYSYGYIEITVDSTAASTLNSVKGSAFTFRMDDIVSVDDDTCRFETSGSASLYRGRDTVANIKSSNSVNFYIGNVSSVTGSVYFTKTVKVNQTYAYYHINTHGGYANGGVFVDYKGVCWKISVSFTKYTYFTYGSTEVISNGTSAGSKSSDIQEINTGKENLRDSEETASDWTDLFRTKTFSVTLFE